LAIEGVPVPLIQQQLDHASLHTTTVYLRHIAPVERRCARGAGLCNSLRPSAETTTHVPWEYHPVTRRSPRTSQLQNDSSSIGTGETPMSATLILAIVAVAGSLGGVLVGKFWDRSAERQRWARERASQHEQVLQERRSDAYVRVLTAVHRL